MKPRTLLVVPPFASINRPSLAAHLLQACARQGGFVVDVLYANIAFAAAFGAELHQKMSYTSASVLIGDRIFSRTAHMLPSFGRNFYPEAAMKAGFDVGRLREVESQLDSWLDSLVESIIAESWQVVGCSSTFEQTSASIAILRRVKSRCPETKTILGGANCEGEMANGVASLTKGFVDHIFSGESESTFPSFLVTIEQGNARLNERIVNGSACKNLDALPTPQFSEYFAQLRRQLPTYSLDNIWVPYESSRGCWWGEKHHCTFCGINGTGMSFRERSHERVLEDLIQYREDYQCDNICMLDNIMPHKYFDTLLPALADRKLGLHIFYEQKANLNLRRVQLLRTAGVDIIQPGIEALSSPLLKLMKKGVSAAQNLDLLRFARTCGVSVNWNLLWGFPQDKIEWYEDTLKLLPLIRHLQPPTGIWPLSIERFSPYFDRPETFGIQATRPVPSYGDTIPAEQDASTIAYHFLGDFPSGSYEHRDVIGKLIQEVYEWRKSWYGDSTLGSVTAGSIPQQLSRSSPFLGLAQVSDDLFVLVDTRGLIDGRKVRFIDAAQARALISQHESDEDPNVKWAINEKLLACVDNQWIPLVCGVPSFFERMKSKEPERKSKHHGSKVHLPMAS